MKGRPIIVEYQGEPRCLSEVGRLIGVAPRTMVYRYAAGKRGAALFAPVDERMKRRGRWPVGDVVSERERSA
jgi:hypothetical protein